MNKAKAHKLGFKPVPLWEGYYPGEWRRELKRPHCSEYWHPSRPDVVSRVQFIGSCSAARSITTRKV